MCVPCTWNGCTELAPRTEGSLIGAARAAASSTQSHTAGHSLPWRRTPKITFTQVACGAVWIWKEAEGRRYAEAWGAGLHTLMPTMQPARGCPGLVHVSHRLTFPGLGMSLPPFEFLSLSECPPHLKASLLSAHSLTWAMGAAEFWPAGAPAPSACATNMGRGLHHPGDNICAHTVPDAPEDTSQNTGSQDLP